MSGINKPPGYKCPECGHEYSFMMTECPTPGCEGINPIHVSKDPAGPEEEQ
jgi:hypothetical protein